MGAIMNGMALVKVRPFGAGFLIFSDYGRMPIRLAALMEIPVIYVFTHDSIGVGEDGPTHQPVEQLASLRAIPGLTVIRPADANEVVEAWRYIMQAPSRSGRPGADPPGPADPRPHEICARPPGLHKGAYVLADAPDGKPDVLLMATGSEVSLCVGAYEQLKAEGVKARVVSMPSWEVFEPADRVPSQRDPARRHGAGGRRAGLDVRLGSLHRPDRRDHRHAYVRRLGPAQGAPEGVQFHRRSRYCCGQGPIGESPVIMANRLSPGEAGGDSPAPRTTPLLRAHGGAAAQPG